MSSISTPSPFVSATTSTATTPPLAVKSISHQIHAILYSPDSPHAWDFLKTNSPFPVSVLIQQKKVIDLLFKLEPGPTVDWSSLRTNLAILKPYAINTRTGPQILQFFKSLIELQAKWLLAIARVEAYRTYQNQLHGYYVLRRQIYTQQVQAAGYVPDEADVAYERECQEYEHAAAGNVFMKQEQRLMAKVETETVNLVTCKVSEEMWRSSAILWAMVDKYRQWQRARQGDISQRRALLKERNEMVGGAQMGMQQVDADDLDVQQDWGGQSMVDASNTNLQQAWTVHGIEF